MYDAIDTLSCILPKSPNVTEYVLGKRIFKEAIRLN